MTHVDDAVFAQMRDGVLAPGALLEADDHLAACETCRARFAAIIAAESPHLGPEDIAALAEGAGSLEAQAHLAACPLCADEVRALAPFVTQVDGYARGRRRMVGRVAAGIAAALVVSTGAWWLTRAARPDGGAAVLTSLDAARRLSPRNSAWINELTPQAAADAARHFQQSRPHDHLLIGALWEQAGDSLRAADEYRAFLKEKTGQP